MDPNANLREQRELARKILTEGLEDPADAERLAELVEALNEWLVHGCFLPRAWQQEKRNEH